MDNYTQRKLNVLVHLAMVDGKFHKAEKALINDFVNERGFEIDEFEMLKMPSDNLEDLKSIDDKKEMLYLAYKLIRADNIVDESEVVFYKKLASRLGYKSEVVDILRREKLTRRQFDELIVA